MRIRHLLAGLVCLASMPTGAFAAEISGRVTDEHGQSLPGMSVRLFADAPIGCIGLTVTDDDGHYHFRFSPRWTPWGLVERDFTVEVLGDTLSSYIFTPAQAIVTVSRQSALDDDVHFTGAFDFRNFQQLLRLTGDDFPELANFDLDGDYVFLKVYTSDPDDPSAQDLIFLGRVTSMDSVVVEASITRSMTGLQYEIFGTGGSVNGTIAVSGGGIGANDLSAECRTRARFRWWAMRGWRERR